MKRRGIFFLIVRFNPLETAFILPKNTSRFGKALKLLRENDFCKDKSKSTNLSARKFDMKYITTVPLIFILIVSIIVFSIACQSSNTNQFTITKTGSQTSTDIIPSQIGLVNDYSKVLDQPTKEHLESTLAKLKQRSNIEFAVVIVDTLGNQTLENYSMGIAQKWNFDSKTQKDGKILLLIAIKDQQWRINVTENLWKDLPDKTLTELETTLTEPFGEERFGEGITKYVDAIIDKLNKKRGFVINN